MKNENEMELSELTRMVRAMKEYHEWLQHMKIAQPELAGIFELCRSHFIQAVRAQNEYKMPARLGCAHEHVEGLALCQECITQVVSLQETT